MSEQAVSEQDLVDASASPVTVASISADLRRLGLDSGAVVCVHSSLSRLGWVCGGAIAVVEALRAVLGPSGTLVVPTHTSGISDPAGWQRPPVPEEWWATIRDQMPPFRPEVTPTVHMGAVAEVVRTWPGALRSDHPQVSFAALGTDAAVVTADHTLDHMLGEGSPLARLYDLDAMVLLLGVGYDRNTSLHLAEYRSGIRPATTTSSGRIVVDGQPVWRRWDDIEIDEADFPEIGEQFEAAGHGVEVGPVGTGIGRLMSQRSLVDFGTAWFRAKE